MVSALEKIGHLEYAEVERSVLLDVDVQEFPMHQYKLPKTYTVRLQILLFKVITIQKLLIEVSYAHQG